MDARPYIDADYVLETPRLLLRFATLADMPSIVLHLSNPAISETTLTIPYPYREEDAREWILGHQHNRETGSNYVFLITLRDSGEIIGAIGLHLQLQHHRGEAGYWVAKPFWNKGYASEALSRLIEFGFSILCLQKIYATHMTGNPSSGRVMQKAGMRWEADLVDHYKKGNHFVSVVQYRLTLQEFLNGRSGATYPLVAPDH